MGRKSLPMYIKLTMLFFFLLSFIVNISLLNSRDRGNSSAPLELPVDREVAHATAVKRICFTIFKVL